MEILEAHLLVPCYLNDENVNKYAVNAQKLIFQNKIWNIWRWEFLNQTPNKISANRDI